MKYINATVIILSLSSCVTNPNTPSVKWISTVNTDEFTDQSRCSVTVGSLYTSTSAFTYAMHYYPFIETTNNELRLGIKSGGKQPIPVGDVQIRIDSNPAWTISTSETPIDFTPNGAVNTIDGNIVNLTTEQQQQVRESYNKTMKITTQMMSPFTATSGDKAKKILLEMLHGSKIKYRTIGLNQAASTTGEYEIDSSFKIALSKCGIN